MFQLSKLVLSNALIVPISTNVVPPSILYLARRSWVDPDGASPPLLPFPLIALNVTVLYVVKSRAANVASLGVTLFTPPNLK